MLHRFAQALFLGAASGLGETRGGGLVGFAELLLSLAHLIDEFLRLLGEGLLGLDDLFEFGAFLLAQFAR